MDRLPSNSIQTLDLIKDSLLSPKVNHLAPFLVAKALERHTSFLNVPCKFTLIL